jgi:hypothetical protein
MNISEVVASITVVFVFIIERIINSVLRRREVERSWYHNVLIAPALSSITKFYNKISNDFPESIESLNVHAGAIGSTEDHTLYVTSELSKYYSRIRRFQFRVVDPIISQHPETHSSLSFILTNLSSKISENLTEADYLLNKEDTVYDFEGFIKDHYCPTKILKGRPF